MTRVHKAKQIELVLKSHMTRKLSHDIQIPPTTKVLSLEDLNFQTPTDSVSSSENEEKDFDYEKAEFECCDLCEKLFKDPAGLEKHNTDTEIQCGFCHICVVRGKELDCPELRKCVELEHMNLSWHPTFYILDSDSSV